jgi:HK97 family phage portal protein
MLFKNMSKITDYIFRSSINKVVEPLQAEIVELRSELAGTKDAWMEFGAPTDGSIVTVNRNTALTFSAIWACIQVLSETIASMPLGTYEEKGDYKNIVKDHSTYRLLHNEPNKLMTSFTWRQTMMVHLLTDGNAYSEIIRGSGAEAKSLNILDPETVTPGVTPSGVPFYTVREEGKERKIKGDNMLHLVGLTMTGLTGLSPISAHKQAIMMALNTQSFGNAFYANNAAIGTVLEHPGVLKHETALRIGRSFDAKHKGIAKAGSTAVLEEGMKVSKMTLSQTDAQYVETMRFTIEEACRIFRVPPHMVADLSRSTNNNIEEQGISFVRDTIMPYVRRWEDELNRKLFREDEKGIIYAEFNVNGLMRGNAAARAQYYAIMRTNKIMNANEIRALENMNPYEGGEIYENPNTGSNQPADTTDTNKDDTNQDDNNKDDGK